MENIITNIRALFEEKMAMPLMDIQKLPQSGSDRMYFRLLTADQSFIATYGRNLRENNTFLYFSRQFRAAGSPVPQVFAINDEKTIYIQEDFGDITLLNQIDTLGKSNEVFALFQSALKQLAHLQIAGDRELDYSYCITSREFGKQAIMSDLLYFKYYFLDTLQTPYDKEQLLDEFDQLSNFLTKTDHKFFMFRDFQSRNIMVQQGDVHFIDYQGGMKGALQYDVASLLWQARAELPDEWKSSLLDFYIDCVEDKLQEPVNRAKFKEQYNGYVLIRLLQVLGAYGFRGLFERKAHFLTSIPLALKNLRQFLDGDQNLPLQTGGMFKTDADAQAAHNPDAGGNMQLPEFSRLLDIITGNDIINKFQPVQATDNTPLTVHINSFSYKKGIPADLSGNGGGFVFDCRGLLNPGRYKEYKQLTGRDKSVQDFLEQRTRMADFLNSVFNIVDISVEDYITRGFSDLQISFGCTGGQHRSVFAADSLARHLMNKFRVKIELSHIEQESKKWINV